MPLVDEPDVVPPEGACGPEAAPSLLLRPVLVPGAPVGSFSRGLQPKASPSTAAAMGKVTFVDRMFISLAMAMPKFPPERPGRRNEESRLPRQMRRPLHWPAPGETT